MTLRPLVLICVCLGLFGVATSHPAQAQPLDVEGLYYPTQSLDDVVAQMGGPTVMSLEVKDAPLATVLSDIAKQTGFRLEPVRNVKAEELPRITLNSEKMPFWLVVRALTLQTGVSFRVANSQGVTPATVYAFTDATSSFQGVSFVQSPFLLIANNLRQTSVTTVSFGDSPGLGNLSLATRARIGVPDSLSNRQETKRAELYFSLFVDPKISGRISTQARIESAVDENGKTLRTVPIYQSSPFAASGLETSHRLTIPLVLPPDVGHRIARVSGVVTAHRARQTEVWEIADALNAPKETHTLSSNGVTIAYTFEGVSERDGIYQVQLRATADLPLRSRTMGRNEVGLIPSPRHFSPALRLLDGNGTALNSSGLPPTLNNGTKVLHAMFRRPNTAQPNAPAPKAPFKLVIEMPKEFVEIKVPFEFTNLPLS